MRRNAVGFLSVIAGCVVVLLAVAHSTIGGKLLRYGARRGHNSIIKSLTILGVNVNATEIMGGTALFYAAANGHTAAAQLLLARGAVADLVDKKGNTALCYALNTPEPNVELAKLLIEHGALVKESRQGSALMCIGHSASSEAYIGLLLEQGVDVNAADQQGYTALMKFAYDGNPEAVSLLIQHGAHLNATTKDGKSALSEAVSQGREKIVDILLRAGANRQVSVDGASLVDIADKRKGEYESINPATVAEYARIITLLESAKTTTRSMP